MYLTGITLGLLVIQIIFYTVESGLKKLMEVIGI
jgi:hypothetical protein